MNNNSSVFSPFALSIYAKASYLKHNSMSKFEKARLLESISDDIKKCTTFTKPKISKAALVKSAVLNIDLHKMNWHNQNKFDPGRKIFHYEHYITVSNIRNICLRSENEDDILRILISIPQIVWILKEEDNKLTKLGYRSKRSNPEEAYWKAEIEIVE
jgi:hypothetical protein